MEPVRGLECCPSCGNLVPLLDNFTGWCFDCTNISDDSMLRQCTVCKRTFKGVHRTCSTCRYLHRLEVHKERIDELVKQGMSKRRALELASSEKRPNCKCCGEKIERTPLHDKPLFCTKHPKCRSAKRRYRYLKDRGMSKEAALVQILEELREWQQVRPAT